MHIVGLEVENYGRIKAVSLEPDETGAVVISGRNAQGKSSLLNATWAALGGRGGNTAAKPVREGADEARVTVDLGDMIVTRIWRNDTTALKVQSREGAEYRSPQTLLDGFIGKLSFDPLAFTRLRDREQKNALLQLVELDIDLDTLDRRRQEVFDQRTEIGRERKALGGPVVDESLPIEEKSAAALLTKIRAANEQQSERARLEHVRDVTTDEVAHLRERLAALTAELDAADARRINAVSDLEGMSSDVDVAPLEAELAGIENDNARIRENNARRQAAEKVAALDTKREELTADIEQLDQQKTEALARASFPVDGLGFDADGITFNGVPFSQASSAEQIRVSMAMAIEANPKLRVVRVMDGSLLDDEGMKIITDMAAANEFQVWIERVANGDGVGFVIEDGELREGPDA